ncbi:MAG TPA: uracil-DNA glycosylase family protein, partial [Pseudomonadales bacterium]|nr:uracil-DNA glycosylase family protein [Pseudomonadales bacterium]
LAYHLPQDRIPVTERVQAWQQYWPNQLPLPHPSPRNALWLKRNPWFETDVLPALKQRIKEILSS